ncbi:MAG: DUF554 family protein, partial [Anaerolineae bacterium]
KSTLDGFAALAFAASLGIGVGFSAITILLFQGGISLGAGLLQNAFTGPAGARDDTRLWLYNAGLNQIDYNDDISYPSNNYSRISRQCGVNPLSTGTYYAKVDEWGNNNTIATYYLSLTVSPCP